MFRRVLLASLLVSTACIGQQIRKPDASLADAATVRAALAQPQYAALRAAMEKTPSCVKREPVAAPAKPMVIPHHYLVGSNGPTNPEEAKATIVYHDFEYRVTGGMNRWLAFGDEKEAACALEQLDTWAQGGALLEYDPKESSQAWFQTEWTLASAGVSMSMLVQDKTLDAATVKRVLTWMDHAATRMVGFERPGKDNNNHHYWRALAAISVGVAADDHKLFAFGVDTYKEGIADIDQRGALPKEMARHENAIHYQAFALAPLAEIAQFAARQGIDLFPYRAHGRTIQDAVRFLGEAVQDPAAVKPYTNDVQRTGFHAGDFNTLNFVFAALGTKDIAPSLVEQAKQPAWSTRTGGDALLFLAH